MKPPGIKNFLEALKQADGIYCKLLNDYVTLDNEALLIIKEFVSKYSIESPDKIGLFFVSDLRSLPKGQKFVEIYGVNELIVAINNKITWVSNSGFLKKQISEFTQYDIYDDKLLSIMYWSLHIAKTRNRCVVCNIKCKSVATINASKRKLLYNFFTPHVVWYYEIINYFTKLTKAEYRFDRTRLITDFIGGQMINYLILHKDCAFDLTGSWKILFKYFYDVPMFYVMILSGCKRKFRIHVKNIIIKLGLDSITKKIINKYPKGDNVI